MDRWRASAPADQVRDVRAAMRQAFGDWMECIGHKHELHDLARWCPRGMVMPRDAARAASVAAGELAVICATWPRTIDAALSRVGSGLRG